MSAQKILIVEDEPKLSALLAEYLAHSSFQTHQIYRGDEVVSWIRQNAVDLVLLDLMLPGTDGMTVCRDIRQFSQVPILMCTARVDEIDRLLGLELGADDYICKPYSPREVVARVKAVLRRAHAATTATDICQLDPGRHRLVMGDKHCELTAVEFQLVRKLVSAPGRIFSRTQLMDDIYPDHRVVSDRTIDSHIKKIRKKLKSLSDDHEFIHSVYGAGYRFETPPPF